MTGLASEQCAQLNAGSRLATPDEAAMLGRQLPGWNVVNGDVDRLERVFRFETFAQALEFTVKVGTAAETQGHHPKLITEWGRTTVTWWTHFLGGLHRNDFIMAARTDALL